MCISLCKLGKCPNPLFYRCKFLERLNHYINFDFSGKTRTKTGDSLASWRLPSPPIVGEKHVHFLMYWESGREDEDDDEDDDAEDDAEDDDDDDDVDDDDVDDEGEEEGGGRGRYLIGSDWFQKKYTEM